MSHEPTADYLQMQRVAPYCEATDGGEYDGDECWMIPVLIPVDDVADLLANYDPDSGTSPLVATARPLARVILDALLRKVSE
tara:strand:- start:5449 stop:5694 length:246 start_codon:yes stop_codon:yes gene_type:complete